MLDLHNHILPGLDDGASDWSQSLAMARLAVEDGVKGVVCTPHWVSGRYNNTRPVILDAVRELEKRLKAAGIVLQVYPGAELRLEAGIARAIRNRELLTLNDTGLFALIELPDSALPPNLERFLWALQVQKITPVISHPERNGSLIRDPERIYRWVEKGILVQITAASLSGAFGKRVRDFSAMLVNHNLAHVVATDAHGMRVRTPLLSAAYKTVENIKGEGAAKKMFIENPQNILSGLPVTQEDPIPLKRPAASARFWRRQLPFLVAMIAAVVFLSGCGGSHVQQPGSGLEAAVRPGQEGAVKEITLAETAPPADTLIRLTRQDLSPVEYIREKFKGKEVLFPEQIPLSVAGGPSYLIGPEDELHVFVWRNPDLSMDTVVREDGKISFPLVGEVHAGGLSIPELEIILQQKYSRYLENPQVTVTARTINSLKVYITGAVRVPDYLGRRLLSGFPLPPDRRLLSALSQVEILSEADLREVYVLRGGHIIPIDLQKLIQEGDVVQNILLEANDTVVIPGLTKQITVLGEVNQPGRHRVQRRTRLLDALAVAGGVNDNTAALEMAYVARDRKILPVNFKRLIEIGDPNQNILMEDNDIIHVPSINENKIFVMGEVSRPGVVRYRTPMDVIEAVGEAGDFLETAQRRQVVVVRGGLHEPRVYAVNALDMMRGASGQRFILNRHDIVYVPRTFIANWDLFIRQLLPTANLAYFIDRMYDYD